MIIEIEGYGYQAVLTGKKCSRQQLKQFYLQAKNLAVGAEDVPALFSRLHHFDFLSWDEELEVDYVIDTDTDRIYTPSY